MTLDHTDRTELLREGGIDHREAMERFCGNEALYERLALKFLDDPHFAELEQALSDKDAQAAYRAAHSLKGVAGNLSLRRLYDQTCRLCDALRASDLDAAERILPDARAAYSAVRRTLRRLKGEKA
ncbi:Hpt domain protein [Coriobacteriaceae bacterium CHKCI002]|nr:Hpt domain protein [Coriobacteriaceae bacterium CHKCI002]